MGYIHVYIYHCYLSEDRVLSWSRTHVMYIDPRLFQGASYTYMYTSNVLFN